MLRKSPVNFNLTASIASFSPVVPAVCPFFSSPASLSGQYVYDIRYFLRIFYFEVLPLKPPFFRPFPIVPDVCPFFLCFLPTDTLYMCLIFYTCSTIFISALIPDTSSEYVCPSDVPTAFIVFISSSFTSSHTNTPDCCFLPFPTDCPFTNNSTPSQLEYTFIC